MILFMMLSTCAGSIFGKPKHRSMLSHKILEMVGVVMAELIEVGAPTVELITA